METANRNHARNREVVSQRDERTMAARENAHRVKPTRNGCALERRRQGDDRDARLRPLAPHGHSRREPFSLEMKQGILIVRIEQLDLMNRRAVWEIERAVMHRLGRCDAVIVDFSYRPVRATIRFFLALCNLHRKATSAGLSFRLCGLTQEVRDVLDMAGFFFTICDSSEQAMRELISPARPQETR